MVVQGDSQSQASHLLFEFIKDAEVTVDAIVLGDQLQQGHSNKSKNDVITLV